MTRLFTTVKFEVNIPLHSLITKLLTAGEVVVWVASIRMTLNFTHSCYSRESWIDQGQKWKT